MDESPTKPSKYLLQQKRCHFASESSRLSHFVRFVFFFLLVCLFIRCHRARARAVKQNASPSPWPLLDLVYGPKNGVVLFFFFNSSSYVFSPMQHRTLTSYIEMHVRPQRIRTTMGKTAYAVVFFIWVVFYLAP